MIDFIQAVVDGTLIGLVYGLLGLSIVIIFKASETFNFAVGEFLIIGAFLFYVLFFDLDLPFWLSLPLGVLITSWISPFLMASTMFGRP